MSHKRKADVFEASTDQKASPLDAQAQANGPSVGKKPKFGADQPTRPIVSLRSLAYAKAWLEDRKQGPDCKTNVNQLRPRGKGNFHHMKIQWRPHSSSSNSNSNGADLNTIWVWFPAGPTTTKLLLWVQRTLPLMLDTTADSQTEGVVLFLETRANAQGQPMREPSLVTEDDMRATRYLASLSTETEMQKQDHWELNQAQVEQWAQLAQSCPDGMAEFDDHVSGFVRFVHLIAFGR